MESNTKTSGAAKYVEPKGWNELNQDERIERLREMIKNVQSSISYQTTTINNLQEAFEKHIHVGDKLVQPYNRYSNNSSLGGLLSSSTPNSNPYF